MLVHYKDEVYKFKWCAEGLYYYDTVNSKPNKSKTDVTSYSFLETVKDNKEHYTSHEIKGAELARKTQQAIGWPSKGKYRNIIKRNLIQNSGITIDNINRAEISFSIPTPLLKGKMIRRVPFTNRIEKVPLPLPIAQRHKKIQLYIDFFFINGHPFLHTKSSKINFLTAHICSSRSQ